MRLAIILGPYRNLSTLVAATLSLRRDCLVLNHAADRLLADPKLDFFTRVNAETLAHFMDAAREASREGTRGDFGGSILHSHAFGDPALKALYVQRFGEGGLKPYAQCLVWKDSMRVQNRLMADCNLFDRLCSAFPDLRFLLPMREVLDCAQSNLSTGYIKHLGGKRGISINTALDRVLDAFVWALEQREKHAHRIFVLTQGDDPQAAFSALGEFLGLNPDEAWLNDASRVFKVKSGAEHDDSARLYARDTARARLARWPDILKRLGY